MLDYIFLKPAGLQLYGLHQLTAELINGGKALFTDFGDHIVVRTDIPLNGQGKLIRSFKLDDILVFELRASVGTKVKGKHRYYPLQDWSSRHEWLHKRGLEHGFELLTVNCKAQYAEVVKDQKKFTVDQTDFTGALKVVDVQKFTNAIHNGIGNKAKAFGFGMIHI